MAKDHYIVVQNLALELTRKCNLNCEHCVRGCAENKEMPDKTIERVFEEIDAVKGLEFIGGETSLATHKLRKVLEVLKEKKTTVNGFFVFTNAVDISDEYIELLVELRKHALTTTPNKAQEYFVNTTGLVERLDSNEYPLRVIVSLDKYHLDSMRKLGVSKEKVCENIEKLASLFPVEIDKMCNYTVYNEGKAVSIADSYKTKTPKQKYAVQYAPETKNLKGLLYIGPLVGIQYDGGIVECNKTYEFNDMNKVGNINENSFLEMCRGLKKVAVVKQAYSYIQLHNLFKKYSHIFSTTTKEIKKMMKFYQKRNENKDFSYFYEIKTDFKKELSK